MCVEMKSKPFVRISGTEVRAKEVILVCLALALLVFSITLFFKNWRKNYWDINQLPYYAYLYKDTENPPTLHSSGMATPTHNEIIDENCSLDRTPSGRFISRSRPSSFRTISMEPISPTGPPTGMNSFRMPPMRTRSLKRNRSSFIHVTAEAMQRQRSLRVHNNPWEYNRNRMSQKRRRTVPSRLAMDSTELKNLKLNSAINKAICEEKVVISNIDNEIFIEMNQQQHQPESIEEETEDPNHINHSSEIRDV